MNRKREKATIIEAIDEPLEMEVSSGNVFADLGFENAAEHLLKAGLMAKIQRIIRQSGLTKKAAAKAMGIDPSKLSNMLVGEFEDDSVELLMRHLVALGVDVEIVVKPKTHETGELRVALHLRDSALMGESALQSSILGLGPHGGGSILCSACLSEEVEFGELDAPRSEIEIVKQQRLLRLRKDLGDVE